MRDCEIGSYLLGMVTALGLSVAAMAVLCIDKKKRQNKQSETEGMPLPEEQCVPVNYANKCDCGDECAPTDPCGYESGDAYHDL